MNSGRFKIPLIYTALGILWVILTNFAIIRVSQITGYSDFHVLTLARGFLFIFFTAIILFLLLDNERKKLAAYKAELAKHNRQLENTLDSITDSFFTVNREGIITRANHNFYITTGIKEDVTGKPLAQVFAGTESSPFRKIFDDAMNKSLAGKTEDFSPALNKWLRSAIFPTEDGVAVYFSDITTEKEKDIQLKLALERYDLASLATGDVIYDLDLVNHTLVFNTQISVLINIPDTDHINTMAWWMSLIHPHDLDGFNAAQDGRIERKEKFWLTEYRIMLNELDYKHVSDQRYLIFDENDNPVRAIGSIKDIDLLKRSTEQLKRTGEILNRINNPVIISNADGMVIWVNPAFSEVTGYSAEEVMGEGHISMLYNTKTNQLVVEQMIAAVSARESFSAEVYNYDKYGREYWVLLNLNPIFDAQGNLECYISVQNDITEHKEREAVISLQNQKLKAVSWLNSHEIRRPVASILALANLMKLSADEEEKAELLDLLQRCTVELDEIILEINAEATGLSRIN